MLIVSTLYYTRHKTLKHQHIFFKVTYNAMKKAERRTITLAVFLHLEIQCYSVMLAYY